MGNYHAGFGPADEGLSTPKKLAASASSDWNVILHPDLNTLKQLQQQAQAWLAEMGLRFKPSKTRITHTLVKHQGNLGFDFLGFTIRQYPVGKHRTRTYRGKPGFKTLIKPSKTAIKRHLFQLKSLIRQHRGLPQAVLIAKLNPIIRGWSNYYRTCVAKQIFELLDTALFWKLAKWADYRHPRKLWHWRYQRYWRRHNDVIRFSDGAHILMLYQYTPIQRHIKVKGTKSPFDGDWLYWSTRLGKDPSKPKRLTALLKMQQGQCAYCGLHFRSSDVLEIHHRDGNHHNHYHLNLALLHGHCHDIVHRSAVPMTAAT